MGWAALVLRMGPYRRRCKPFVKSSLQSHLLQESSNISSLFCKIISESSYISTFHKHPQDLGTDNLHDPCHLSDFHSVQLSVSLVPNCIFGTVLCLLHLQSFATEQDSREKPSNNLQWGHPHFPLHGLLSRWHFPSHSRSPCLGHLKPVPKILVLFKHF